MSQQLDGLRLDLPYGYSFNATTQEVRIYDNSTERMSRQNNDSKEDNLLALSLTAIVFNPENSYLYVSARKVDNVFNKYGKSCRY